MPLFSYAALRRWLGDETSFPACISVVKGESKTDCQINTPASESVVGVVPMPTDVYIIDTKPAGFKIYFNLKSSELTENKELMLGIYKLEESTTECYIYNFSQCDHRQTRIIFDCFNNLSHGNMYTVAIRALLSGSTMDSTFTRTIVSISPGNWTTTITVHSSIDNITGSFIMADDTFGFTSYNVKIEHSTKATRQNTYIFAITSNKDSDVYHNMDATFYYVRDQVDTFKLHFEVYNLKPGSYQMGVKPSPPRSCTHVGTCKYSYSDTFVIRDDPCRKSICDRNMHCALTDNGASYNCVCDNGFTLMNDTCTYDDPCLGVICDSNMHCELTDNGASYNCLCDDGFTLMNDKCTNDISCYNASCGSKMHCELTGDGNGRNCVCDSGFILKNGQCVSESSVELALAATLGTLVAIAFAIAMFILMYRKKNIGQKSQNENQQIVPGLNPDSSSDRYDKLSHICGTLIRCTPTGQPRILLLCSNDNENHMIVVGLLARFLQDECACSVIYPEWHYPEIARLGPVQWVCDQVQKASKIIFVMSEGVERIWRGQLADAEFDAIGLCSATNVSNTMLSIAINLMCADISHDDGKSRRGNYIYVTLPYSVGTIIPDPIKMLGSCYRVPEDVESLYLKLYDLSERSPTTYKREVLSLKQRLEKGDLGIKLMNAKNHLCVHLSDDAVAGKIAKSSEDPISLRTSVDDIAMPITAPHSTYSHPSPGSFVINHANIDQQTVCCDHDVDIYQRIDDFTYYADSDSSETSSLGIKAKMVNFPSQGCS
uniref:Uncharacterized protein LOC102807786 n=1 Tax=Saccoglossus kowalevskii TaxID=10224 RepID=A0ABM0LX22_SACKO|nr:PREDICTED: uncharacterized protein LOC102807786 [Saccoglossus kowalevskii]